MSEATKHYCRALTIAGSDSGGGAGIQADLKTFSALGCYGASVITALTAQNTRGVTGIHAVPPEFAVQQIDAVLSDIGADAVKIGMLFSAELIEQVAWALKKHRVNNIVLDPVMVATSGDKLVQDDAIEAIRTHLLPMARVATPNLPEAEVLVGRTLDTPQAIQQAAAELAASGCESVLIKGGHSEGDHSVDYFYLAADQTMTELSDTRIPTNNTHGTGCTLSSAIAAELAKGSALTDAVQHAKTYIQQAITAGADYDIGHGCGPVHLFWKFWS